MGFQHVDSHKCQLLSASKIKLHVDGAYKEDKGGIGIVARNERGRVVFSSIFPMLATTSTLHVETLAILKRIELVETFNLCNVIIEIDYMAIVQGVHSQSMEKSPMGHLFQKIQTKVNVLHSIQFSFAKRLANVQAHEMSKIAMLTNDACTWSFDVPLAVTLAILADLSI